ncbi:MAG: zf-TFIIB domain-containing protein [Myxococcales bacterium]|nr:zf-TFIIB domain-containing protein [Myxococcales bacterium]
MPAKTPSKKASAAKKPAAKKSTTPHKNGAKNGNGASDAARLALEAEHQKAQSDLAAAWDHIAALEKQLAEAKAAGTKTAELETQLREMQARLTTRQAELEASRAEGDNLREAVARASKPPPISMKTCPKCGGKMIEYQHDVVRAERCEKCHGIFFDNGELEAVMKHHDEQLLAGKKSWYSAFFGRK